MSGLKLGWIHFCNLSFRMRSSSVRVNLMISPLIWRKRSTRLHGATLDQSTKRTCWRGIWALVLVHQQGLNFLGSLLALTNPPRLPLCMGTLFKAFESGWVGVTVDPKGHTTTPPPTPPCICVCEETLTLEGKDHYWGQRSSCCPTSEMFGCGFLELIAEKTTLEGLFIN